ncbi:MAG: J domain-containing protein [Alphaproteobacteria bacterium]
MRGEDSYAALGLRPGASRAEIDDAYRRLIKRYHPDRSDGDPGRAAEINRAHTQLTRKLSAPQPPRRKVPVRGSRPPSRRSSRPAWALAGLLAAGIAVLLTVDSPRPGARPTAFPVGLSWPAPALQAGSSGVILADFDEPLNTRIIDRSVADALRLYQSGDRGATVAFSRACHNSLRTSPSLAWFDSCTAFDEAIAILESDNTLAESGPFSSSAVVARHMAAARILARDTLVADSRVQDIRSRVEFELLPQLQDEAAVRP